MPMPSWILEILEIEKGAVDGLKATLYSISVSYSAIQSNQFWKCFGLYSPHGTEIH
jgi:hypothetical protein